MGSRVRFFGAGVAVSAICFLLYSMTWQYVLWLFCLASLGWVVWSWLAESEKDRLRARAERAENNNRSESKKAIEESESSERVERPVTRKRSILKTRASGGESRGRKTGNVLQFPKRERAETDVANRTEAAD